METEPFRKAREILERFDPQRLRSFEVFFRNMYYSFESRASRMCTWWSVVCHGSCSREDVNPLIMQATTVSAKSPSASSFGSAFVGSSRPFANEPQMQSSTRVLRDRASGFSQIAREREAVYPASAMASELPSSTLRRRTLAPAAAISPTRKQQLPLTTVRVRVRVWIWICSYLPIILVQTYSSSHWSVERPFDAHLPFVYAHV